MQVQIEQTRRFSTNASNHIKWNANTTISIFHEWYGCFCNRYPRAPNKINYSTCLSPELLSEKDYPSPPAFEKIGSSRLNFMKTRWLCILTRWCRFGNIFPSNMTLNAQAHTMECLSGRVFQYKNENKIQFSFIIIILPVMVAAFYNFLKAIPMNDRN